MTTVVVQACQRSLHPWLRQSPEIPQFAGDSAVGRRSCSWPEILQLPEILKGGPEIPEALPSAVTERDFPTTTEMGTQLCDAITRLEAVRWARES
jgi:hypothetical protein